MHNILDLPQLKIITVLCHFVTLKQYFREQ